MTIGANIWNLFFRFVWLVVCVSLAAGLPNFVPDCMKTLSCTEEEWMNLFYSIAGPETTGTEPAGRANSAALSTHAALSRPDASHYFEPRVEREFHQGFNSAIYCPPGSFAYGFSQKNDKGCHGGGACSGLLGVELLCSADKKRTLASAKMELGYGFGDESSNVNWRNALACNDGYITGAQALSMTDQGFFGDDQGVMALAMVCDNNAKLANSDSDFDFRNSYRWNGVTYCGAGEAVCGVAGAGSRDLEELFDDWGLTKLRFYCCKVE